MFGIELNRQMERALRVPGDEWKAPDGATYTLVAREEAELDPASIAQSCREADEALAAGTTRPMSEVLAEMATEAKRSNDFLAAQVAVDTAVAKYMEGLDLDGYEPPAWIKRVEENVRNAAWYLVSEECYRVERNRGYGQTRRVEWVEATSAEDARGEPDGVRVPGPYGVGRIISVSRARLSDLEEFIESDPDFEATINGR
jgi:hypothetical protein